MGAVQVSTADMVDTQQCLESTGAERAPTLVCADSKWPLTDARQQRGNSLLELGTVARLRSQLIDRWPRQLHGEVSGLPLQQT